MDIFKFFSRFFCHEFNIDFENNLETRTQNKCCTKAIRNFWDWLFRYWRYLGYCGIVFVILDVKLDILKVVSRVIYGYCQITNFRSQFRYYSRTRRSADQATQTCLWFIINALECILSHFFKKFVPSLPLGVIISQSDLNWAYLTEYHPLGLR